MKNKVEYTTPNEKVVTLEAEGDLSELLQHEIDHLDGILSVNTAITRERVDLPPLM